MVVLFGSSWDTLKGEIVSDGSFEDNAIDPSSSGALNPYWEAPLLVTDGNPHPYWTVSAGTSNVVATDTNLVPPGAGLAPYTGHIAVSFGSDLAGAIAQTLNTVPLKTYNLSLWVANTATAGTNNIFSVSWNGTLISLSVPLSPASLTAGAQPNTYVVTAQPVPGWVQVEAKDLAATGISTPLVISASNNDSYTLVDVMAVQETPEPSTVLMLGIGVMATGLCRRRQRGF